MTSNPNMWAMVGELEALGVLTTGQLEKLSNAVSKEDEEAKAKKSLERLQTLDKSAPSTGRLLRNAAVGGVVAPLAGLAWRAAAGSKARVPGPKGAGQVWPGLRSMGATGAQGAVLGLLPAGQLKLEQEVEKQKLKEYVGHTRRGTLRGEIKRYTGL